MDIHPDQIKNLARCESCRDEDVSNTRAKRQDFISDAECLGSPEVDIMERQDFISDAECLGTPEVEIMDITKELLNFENTDSIN